MKGIRSGMWGHETRRTSLQEKVDNFFIVQQETLLLRGRQSSQEGGDITKKGGCARA
jgi:hypothetical protein